MRAHWLHSLLAAGMIVSTGACGGVDESIGAAAPERSEAETPSSGEVAMSWEANGSAEQLEERRAVEAALSRARAEWERLGIRDYTVKVRRVCFCAPTPHDDVAIKVSKGAVVEVHAWSAPGVYDVPLAVDAQRSWYTVTGMFELVSESITADRVIVEYDEPVGYPSFVLLDYHLLSSEEGDIFEMWDFEASSTAFRD